MIDNFDDRIATARRACLGSLQAKVAELDTLIHSRDNDARRSALEDIAHRVRGTAGSFGFLAVAAAAEKLEKSCIAGSSTAEILGMAEALATQMKAAE